MAQDDKQEDNDLIELTVKHKGRRFHVRVCAAGSVKDLMKELQEVTDVHPRGQKLIFQGKLITARASSKLKDWGLASGSTIMMISADGVHQGPTVSKPQTSGQDPLSWPAGDVHLRDCGASRLPELIWSPGGDYKYLDLTGNKLKVFPEEGKSLPNLKMLSLGDNKLVDTSLNWKDFSSFRSLEVLRLDNNLLTNLSPAIQQLSQLKELILSKNRLETLPEELGSLKRLEILHVNANKLRLLPQAIGQCSSLITLDVSENYLKDLPSSMGELKRLQELRLDNNALKAIPESILKGCVRLDRISFRGNELTLDEFRQMEGWKEYEERRKAKCDKQVAMGLDVSGGFDEGGDSSRVQRW